MLYDALMIFTVLAGVLSLAWVAGMVAWVLWQIHLGNRSDEDHE